MTLVVPDADLRPVDWRQIDDACYDWLNDLLEMDDRIIWENQKVAQPCYPYISLMRNSENDEGIDEDRQRTLDSDDQIVGVDPTAGDPVINEAITYQPVTFTLSIRAQVDEKSGGNDPGGNAMFILSKAKRSLGQRSTIDRLWAAGISIVRPLAVTDSSVVINSVWVNQATLDVLLRTASVITERLGFIDRVELKSVELGVDLLVDAS